MRPGSRFHHTPLSLGLRQAPAPLPPPSVSMVQSAPVRRSTSAQNGAIIGCDATGNAFGVYRDTGPENVMFPFVLTTIDRCVLVKNRSPIGNAAVMSIDDDELSSLGDKQCVPNPCGPPSVSTSEVCAAASAVASMAKAKSEVARIDRRFMK
jgi:hypothetical protein